MLLAGTAALADDHPSLPSPSLAPAPVAPSSTFLDTVIVPRVDSNLRSDAAAALDYAGFRSDPFANPWTHDNRTVQRVGSGAINATQDAVKRYVVRQLGLDKWSLPLGGGSKGGGLSSLRTDSGGMRLRFGVAHMAPRAELLIPSGNTGRVTLGLDGRGRMSIGFETAPQHFHVGGSYDPMSHDANIGFVAQF